MTAPAYTSAASGGVDVGAKVAAFLPEAMMLAQEGAEAAHHVAELRREAGVGVERLDHQRDDEAAVIALRGVLDADARRRCAAPATASVDRRDIAEHAPLELPDAVLHGLEQQLVLVLEVVVDRALGDAGRLAMRSIEVAW